MRPHSAHTAPCGPRRIPPLPGGVVQHREGIQRCALCGGEVVVGRTVGGVLVDLTVCLGNRHECTQQGTETAGGAS